MKHSTPRTSKQSLHPRNKHQGDYPMQELVELHPVLKSYLRSNPDGKLSIDFHNPKAVIALNTALMLYSYKLKFWELPPGALCPPIPGRADYIHYLADVLTESSVTPTKIIKGNQVRVLDVGVGANCVYPLIGHQCYHWSFVGSDISKASLDHAADIVSKNYALSKHIEFRHQANQPAILNHIIQAQEYFDAVICNPPFYKSASEATKVNQRKQRNLNKKKSGNLARNFGGFDNELWCAGGELAFVKRLIDESSLFKKQVMWFSCLVSNQKHLSSLEKQVQQYHPADIRVVNMGQGNKRSRFLAWSFLASDIRQKWAKLKW